MDLFSQLEVEPEEREEIFSKVDELCAFAKGLTSSQLRQLGELMDDQDFDEKQKAARGLKDFLFKKGLRDQWWEVVGHVKKNFQGSAYTRGWDATFDHAVSLLVKPWLGTEYSVRAYRLMVEPLENLASRAKRHELKKNG